MLVQLSIRDIVLIERLDLDLAVGLTVLTGETGAGKSILLDSVSLAIGARGDGSIVRHGQPQGQVTAVFELASDHPAVLAAQQADIESDGQLVLRRIQFADGRTRASVNDQAVSAQTLRSIGSRLVEIHGQHDDRALVDPVTHRALVDVFGGLTGELILTRTTHAALRSARKTLADEEERLAKVRADADFLRHAHAELQKLGARAGEEEALAAERARMMQSEKVASELGEANAALSGEHSPVAMMAGLMRRLERRMAQAPVLIEPGVKALDRAIDAVEHAAQTIAEALRESRYDPRDLERVEERLFALRAAGRKYSVLPDALPGLADKFATDLEALDAGEARLVRLAKDVADAEKAYRAAAAALSKARQGAAARLDEAVNAELPPLKLERARFSTTFAADPALEAAEGYDRIEFWVQTNPGARPGPLMKVASGGELARFMLALKVVLADRGSAPTLVFDEIDTGVGGAVADAIGQRLARLASRVQVLAVTHAPQVAARAATHLRIAKAEAGDGDRVATSVSKLAQAARREEIARMLAGARITDEARAAAVRLLEGAD